ncbi:MAG: 5-formyltetrahydrofolate cyclo-ligase [Nitrospirae bacterium]|nr:5-formyltetrahydrofolate cyclo-ligase [Nitrospirota bacterium]
MNNKSEIRREILKIRDNLSPELRHIKDIEIAKRILSLPQYQAAQTILFFASFRSEVDTFSLINNAFNTGIKVILPKVIRDEKCLIISEINSLKDLQLSKMGILEPISPHVFPINEINLIIMPGAAFDHKRNRLGYGGGYYDKLLAEMTKITQTIAIAYQEQIIPEVPVEPHDIKVDMIITDKEIIT